MEINAILKNKIEEIKSRNDKQYVVCDFLCAYYDDYIALIEDDTNEIAEELLIPLEDRSSGIYEAMEWLVGQGYDLNSGEMNCPLMMAVDFSDFEMTKYLILKGADANYWPFVDEDSDLTRRNYYMESLDIQYYDETFELSKKYVNALLKTAEVLLRYGKTGNFHGLCLSADEQKREILFSNVNYRY